ncbi:hypothetical protein [Streptomyces wedmorensis]
MKRSPRWLAALLPALLWAIWSLVLLAPSATTAVTTTAASTTARSAAASTPVASTPVASSQAASVQAVGTPTGSPPALSPQAAGAPTGGTLPGSAAASAATSAPTGSTPAGGAPAVPKASAAHRLTPPEPHVGDTAVVRLSAAVENPLRFPPAPATPAAVPVDVPVPPRGVLAGDPRRERAPPGGPRGPRDPRGPPSPRHD